MWCSGGHSAQVIVGILLIVNTMCIIDMLQYLSTLSNVTVHSVSLIGNVSIKSVVLRIHGYVPHIPGHG